MGLGRWWGERGHDSEKEENGVPERGHKLKNTVNG